jgi:hypothetical protein
MLRGVCTAVLRCLLHYNKEEFVISNIQHERGKNMEEVEFQFKKGLD